MAANFDQFLGKCSVLGRVVITHSTYVEGLIPWLKSLASEQGIQTITPAVERQCRRCSSSRTCRNRISSRRWSDIAPEGRDGVAQGFSGSACMASRQASGCASNNEGSVRQSSAQSARVKH